MPMYNLIEYSNNYSKTSATLWQYYRDEPAWTGVSAIKNFHDGDNSSASFQFKQKITGKQLILVQKMLKNIKVILGELLKCF